MPLRRVYSLFLWQQTTRSKVFQLQEVRRTLRSSFMMPAFGKMVGGEDCCRGHHLPFLCSPSLTEILLFFGPLRLLPHTHVLGSILSSGLSQNHQTVCLISLRVFCNTINPIHCFSQMPFFFFLSMYYAHQ